MILKLFKKLKGISDDEYNDIIRSSEIIFTNIGRARKLRLKLIDNTYIDIWYSLDGDYSFHWEQRHVRDAIYRHDNAPHKKWNYLKSFPKHCHDGTQENVFESYLSDIPEQALREFLNIIRKKLPQLSKN